MWFSFPTFAVYHVSIFMFKNTLTFLLSSLLLWGCKENTNKIENKVFSPDETAAESKKANQFFDAAFDEYVSRSPMTQTYLGIKTDYTKLDDISPENEKREIDSLSAKLANLKKNIFFDKLDEQTQLSYRLFEYGANLKIEGYKYQWHNYPVNQMFGTHADLQRARVANICALRAASRPACRRMACCLLLCGSTKAVRLSRQAAAWRRRFWGLRL